MNPQIIQQMVAEAMGLPVDQIVVYVQESFLLAAAVIGGGLALASKWNENRKARARADRDALLAKQQAAFNKKQGLQMYGDDGIVRRQAGDALDHARTEHTRGHDQLDFSWDQAQQGYDLQVAGLDHQRGRADEGITRQDLGNQAALGAFGMRGGSSRGRADQDITDAREDVAFGYDQNKTQLDMGLTAAEKQVGWGRDTLDQGMQKAEQGHGYAMEQADMGKESAMKGHEFAVAGIDNAVSDIYSDTGTWSTITAGIQGAVSGAQTGASLYDFNQQYGGQIKQDWGNFKSKFGGNRAGAGGGSFNFSNVGNWGSW